MLLDVAVLTPRKVLFEGRTTKIIVPGESGVFEILQFHKRIVSRLVGGTLILDERVIPIQRGTIKVDQNRVIIIVEEG